MRDVQLTLRVPGVDAAEAYDRISDFARYPDLVDVVRSVTVHPAGDGEPEVSDWEVYFRNGILRWTEEDIKDAPGLKIDFEQVDGDFDSFDGAWTLTREADGCQVRFAATFDFGIPSLAGILDPIAERVLKETIARIVAALLPGVEVVGDEATADALARSQGRVEPVGIGAV